MCTAIAALDWLNEAGQGWGGECLSPSPAMHTPWSNTRCWYDTWLIKVAASRNDWGGKKGEKMRGFLPLQGQTKDPQLAALTPALGDLAASLLWPWSPPLVHTALCIMIF